MDSTENISLEINNVDKWFLLFLCQNAKAGPLSPQCSQALGTSITQFNLYESLKRKSQEAQDYAQDRLTKTGYIVAMSSAGAAATKTAVISGHDILGIQSVTAKVGKTCELSLSWRF